MGVKEDFYADGIEAIELPRIENGSTLTIGRDGHAFIMAVDQHFNWFQKKMIKWCFGVKVRDYRQ